ncbi:phage tail assembly chaperone [Rhodospirillum sp. A1_3_36]|uniref:phage tail assembly chaperone n=1 Tax=Rhodospirillum sp. A1_3_36 TaxID=3391666 RepID=UPI0039A751FF
MALEEFTAGPLTLKPKKMDARKQFHIARRLASLLAKVDGLPVGSFRSAGSATEAEALKIAGAIGEALSSLPDEQVDYILDACLDTVDVKQTGGGWAPLRARGVLMYPIDLPTLLIVVGRVLLGNLAGFTDALPGLGPALAGLTSNG